MSASDTDAQAEADLSDLPYLDGAEAYLADVLSQAGDRSSGSDELQDAVVDWPSQYHLSPLRANLVRPLELGPDTSVLDVGAGTGALARYLGETCGRVVALEGSRARAEVARIRCQDLPNVEVRHGTLTDLAPDERFDVVVVCGVLEYSGADIGGGGGPEEMLRRATAATAKGGVVALAIENQIGLKYLLGACEDHRSVPWVGLEDYPGPPGVRTWTRPELGRLLRDAGLGHQRWMAPFPDYKLPTVILDEALYAEPDATLVLDQLVGRPVQVADAPLERLADAAAAHGVLARAGLGMEVANSFLVLAAPDAKPLRRWARPDVLAWLYGSVRRSTWRRTRILTHDRVLEHLDPPEPRVEGWLTQHPGTDRPFVSGTTLGQQARIAVRRHDLDALGAVLRRWAAHLRAQASPAGESTGTSPFAPTDPQEYALPEPFLDASLDNFVDDGGELRFVDDEWRTAGPVSADLAAVRALWVLARDLVESGIDHPWGVDATVRELVNDMAGRAGLSVDDALIERWQRVEHELQGLVAGAGAEHLDATWTNGETASIHFRHDVSRVREVGHLRARVAELERLLEEEREETGRLRVQREDLFDLGLDYQATIERLEAAATQARTIRGRLAARRG